MNTKKKFKNIIGCIITISLTISLVQYMGHRLDPDWSESGLDVIKAFHSLEDDTLDVIVYGSSHAWKGCDTRVMCNEYGISGWNYSCNWQFINTILLFVQDSLRTQTPKVVCIETGLVNNIEQDVNLDGQIYYTRQITNFKGKREYLKQCFGNNIGRYISYYFPLVMFHDNWNQIDKENYSGANFKSFLDTKGYCVGSEVKQCEFPDYNYFQQSEISEDCMKVLDKIVSICQEKGIQIIFYTCPYAGEYNYGDAMEKYANKNSCTYLNLFEYIDEIELDGKTDLWDEGHLNESGAGKVASFLSKYIINHFEVENSVK